jgi:hypothetical protein
MCRIPLCDFVTLPAAFVNLLAVTSLYVSFQASSRSCCMYHIIEAERAPEMLSRSFLGSFWMHIMASKVR